ncbi:MAG: hypothetical protein J3Q66DRAFT_417221, partial [Benniella sp.]
RSFCHCIRPHSANESSVARWLVSPGTASLYSATSDREVLDVTLFQPNASSDIHHKPEPKGGAASTATRSNYASDSDGKSDNNSNVDQHGIIHDITSRTDMFAGVVVVGLGMLVLMVALTFYLINGRSWKWVRRHRCGQNCHDGINAMEIGPKEQGDNAGH